MLEVRTVVNYEEVAANFYSIFALKNTVHNYFIFKSFAYSMAHIPTLYY